MNQQEFEITKSTVECYKIRHASGCYWADITIDANAKGGRIQIASDYGSWQNYWGAAGSDFKQFLARINEHYAAEKFGAEPRINVERSLKVFKQAVLERRRDESIDSDTAREIWEELDELADVSYKTLENAAYNTVYLRDFLMDVYDYAEFEYEPDPHFRDFWKNLWPLLLAEFERERTLVDA